MFDVMAAWLTGTALNSKPAIAQAHWASRILDRKPYACSSSKTAMASYFDPERREWKKLCAGGALRA